MVSGIISAALTWEFAEWSSVSSQQNYQPWHVSRAPMSAAFPDHCRRGSGLVRALVGIADDAMDVTPTERVRPVGCGVRLVADSTLKAKSAFLSCRSTNHGDVLPGHRSVFVLLPDPFRKYRSMIRKIQPLFASLTWAIPLLLLVLGMQSISSAATIDIEPVVYAGHAVDVSILVGGREQCTIKRKGPDETTAKNEPCRLSLSKADDSIEVAGNYSFEDGTKERRAIRKGRQTIGVVDFEPATRALTRAEAPFGPRVREFMKSARLFASKYKLESFDMEGGKPASSTDIDRAQKRLGYPLPAELVSLLTTIGEIRQGDNSMTSVAKITDSYTTMRQDWGTDEADLTDSYSSTMLAFLKSSTLLYTEVGDGLGGLLFRPPPTKACGAEGIYIWTTQEEGTTNLSMDGACPNFERVFRWLVDRFVIERLADEMQEKSGAVLIDSSSGIQHLALTTEDGEAFRVTLNRTWGESTLEDAKSTGKQGSKK